MRNFGCYSASDRYVWFFFCPRCPPHHDMIEALEQTKDIVRLNVLVAQDDGLDAVAGAISQEPMRVERYRPSAGAQIWTGTHRIFSATTEFEV